ncbi:hypothetical protein Clacol_001105 [Clathrus columnatus]|uniref:F-box domain-containing protein n=1 Tax=Clathrus columnatus TaxID=1419009 RepID=A0AAV5A2E1_9AGAM|nr:hypothetical protein Clacol_001105 [Clathrus columnatus]
MAMRLTTMRIFEIRRLQVRSLRSKSGGSEEEIKININSESPRRQKQQEQSANYSPLNWITPLKSAFTIFRDTPTSSPFALGNTKPLPPIENVRSETLEQLRTPLIISVPDPIVASPNVLGLNFVESPTEYNAADTPFARINYLAILSDKIIDEILAYLPYSYIGILALVSKELASRFRFRRIHSGTDYCPLPTFNQISRRPRLGDNVKRLIIHRTFYRPPIKTQWLLEGSDPVVFRAAWKASEEKKQILLATVLRSCRHISSLTWNEGRLPLPVSILRTVELRLGTSIRHLDISANFNQLVNYLINRNHDPLRNFQLRSIIIRDGFTEETMIAITKFLKLSDSTIRQIHFKDSNFTRLGIQERPLLFTMLCQLPHLERIDFTRPLGLDTAHIPISHIGLEKGLALNIHDPIMAHTPHIRFNFFSPLGHVLSNLTTIILYLQNHTNALITDNDSWHRNSTPEHYRSLAEVISAAVNLRVFAFNAPVPTVIEPTSETLDSSHLNSETHGESNSVIKLPSDILEALITKDKLVSLSLMARVMTPHQLQRICENLPTLSHLGVFITGESIHVSKYSQHFTRLPRLIALDVAIRSFDEYCPCGHEKDPRFPHYEEGTAMGRLCSRFLPRVDTSGQKIPGSNRTNQHLKIVRLSRLGWNYHHHHDLHWHNTTNDVEHDHEINWFCHRNELCNLVENMWGPCEITLPFRMTSSLSALAMGEMGDDATAYSGASASDVLRLGLETEAVRRIFTPITWIDFHPDFLSEMEWL